MRQLLRGFQLAIVTLVTAAGLRAQTLVQDLSNYQTDSDEYNLLAFGNATLNGSSDTQGGVAVGGTLTVGGAWSIASDYTPGSNPSLFLGGSTLSLSGETKVLNGDTSAKSLSSTSWSWSSSSEELTSKSNSSNLLYTPGNGSTSPLSKSGPSGWNWSTQLSNFESISSALENATATGTISVSGQNLTFTAPGGTTSGSVVVFDLDASELSGDSYEGSTFSNIQIDVPDGVNYVINVCNISSGEDLFGSTSINFNSGTNDDQLLWNFEGSNTFTLGASGGSFYGSILAPNSTITDNVTVNGQVVTDNYTNPGTELHDLDNGLGFQAVSALVPEASTFAWWALGLCLVGAVLGRRVLLTKRLL